MKYPKKGHVLENTKKFAMSLRLSSDHAQGIIVSHVIELYLYPKRKTKRF
jgi:hypothetical protein